MRTYRTLARVGTIIKLIGWLTVMGTLLSACGLLVFRMGGSLALPGLTGQTIPLGGLAAGVVGQVIVVVLVVLVGLVYGAGAIAVAEWIELFIDLSTRSQPSVQLLERPERAPLKSQAPPLAPVAAMTAPGAYPPQGFQGQ